MRAWEVFEGGWDSTATQGTVISPPVVQRALRASESLVRDFNRWLANENLPPVEVGKPLGSSAYHEVDSDDTVYGDIDLQIIVPELEELADKTSAQVQGFWVRKLSEFIDSTNAPVHPESAPGHPILSVGDDEWVQVDFIIHPRATADWGRWRTTPHRGVKGLLTGNLFSALGDALNYSIQHLGVVAKKRDGVRLNYTRTRKDYELETVTTNISTWLWDIFAREYKDIQGGDPRGAQIDPALRANPGLDPQRGTDIPSMVEGIRGLARSLEANGLFGQGNLSEYRSAQDFLDRFLEIYTAKAQKNIDSPKRLKAATPQAQARAQAEIEKIQQGLEWVQGLVRS